MHSEPSTGDERDSEAGGVAVAPEFANPSDSQLLGESANSGKYKIVRSHAHACLSAPSQNGVQAGIEATILHAADVCDRVQYHGSCTVDRLDYRVFASSGSSRHGLGEFAAVSYDEISRCLFGR
jgi:hypothetical protein